MMDTEVIDGINIEMVLRRGVEENIQVGFETVFRLRVANQDRHFRQGAQDQGNV